MRGRPVVLTLIVVVLWGLNFVAIEIALRTFPPLFLCTLRFVFAAFPAIFFVRRPAVPLPTLVLYGLANFAMQFGFLFSGMKLGVPAGLASLVPQVQVFFTMFLAMRAFGDRPRPWQWIGAMVAFVGIGVVAEHAHGDVSPVGLGLLLLGALSWATGNITAKRAGAVNPFGLVIWASVIAIPPLLALSLAVEGPAAIGAALRHASIDTALALGYIVYVSTLLCYSLWAYLMRRYAPSSVAPFTLLVPVVGFLGALVLLGEALPAWKLGAAALVVAGLSLNVFGGRLLGVARQRLAH